MMHKDLKINNEIRCYMDPEYAEANKDKIIKINDRIMEGLKGTNVLDVRFDDIFYDGIQVSVMHKQFSGAVFVCVRLEKDFSNMERVIDEAIKLFKEKDTPEKVNSYMSFLDDITKYGSN